MRSKLLKSVFPSLAMLAVVGAAPAQAALVNTWDYTVTSSFSNSVFSAGTGTVEESDTELSWGEANGDRSSIGVVGTPTSGSIQTNGPNEAADDYFHNNNPIPLSSRALRSTTLSINITLTPTDPAGDPLAPPIETSFDINFFETPNQTGTGNQCADGQPEGVGINSAGCSDIFTLAFTEGEFDFTYDDFDYTLFLFEDPDAPNFPQLVFLSDEACTAAGAGLGCFGFQTAEDALTVAEFAISIEAQDVPEPGALGLLGLGLVGLGALGRRRKA